MGKRLGTFVLVLAWLSACFAGLRAVSAADVKDPEPKGAAKESPDLRGADGAAGAASENGIDVEAGRTYWAFQPLARLEPPNVSDNAWCRTPMDRFILAKLEEKGLAPNPAADRRTLIRRAYFDLIGLPPAPEDIEAFLSDSSPDAYEKLIDRLLASPHFGERWARHWLDVARFAESHGFEHDYDRPNAYHYRDFVIKAFNQDVPYDTFVKWQIAGDEYEPENPPAMMATGFLAAGTHATQITANQAEKERYDELDDMVRTIGTSMLGLTLGCARCHDHKYDPIRTRDYYGLVAAFSTTVRSDLDVNLDPEGYKRAKAKFDEEHAPLTAAREKFEREDLPGRFEQWRKNWAQEREGLRWIVVEPIESKSEGGATFTKLEDGSLLAGGKNADQETYTFVVHTQVKGITAVRVEALAHESLAKGGPGRADNGNFGLSDFRLTVAPRKPAGQAGQASEAASGQDAGPAAKGREAQPAAVKLAGAKATFEQMGLPAANAIDDNKESCWAVDPQLGKDHAAAFETEGEIGFEDGSVLTFTLDFRCNKQHSIGRPRLAVSTADRPVGLDGLQMPERVLHALAALDADAESKLSDEERAAVLKWYRTIDPEWGKLNERVEAHAKGAPKPNLAKVLVCSEGVPAVRLHTQGQDFYDPVYFLKRGDPNQKVEVATPGFLQVLMRPPREEKPWQAVPPPGWRTAYRRRALAEWITDAEHGAGQLLARVIVNRLWQHHMGRGIVATPSDFGRQGQPPTHPEMLDWLAGELIRNGWRLKPIHKLILTSAAYMQSAEVDAKKAMIDRENTLFWRHPRRRLEAEAIRDAMLAVSGTLDATMFGPGTLDENHKRRSIYFFVKRSKLVPMMVLFDAPDALQGIERRPMTTVAPQALLMMNNATVRGYAEGFARRLAPLAKESPAEAVWAGYVRALGRPPSEDELADSVAFLEEQRASYQAEGKEKAAELALVDFCQTLMGLNEFVYVD